MERKRTLKLSWDDLGGGEDDDQFFDPRDRLSCAVPLDLTTLGSDDSEDEFEDSRLSLSSSCLDGMEDNSNDNNESSSISMGDYGMWMADPGDIKERRKRLLQGMGLTSNKDLLVKVASSKIARAISRKPSHLLKKDSSSSKPKPPTKDTHKQETDPDPASFGFSPRAEEKPPAGVGAEYTHAMPVILVRSRSDGDIDSFAAETKRRKEEIIGPVSKQRLTRTLSGLTSSRTGGMGQIAGPIIVTQPKKWKKTRRQTMQNSMADECIGSFFLIKNLDTGKEFIVKECNENGMWNKLSDLQTGKQLTMEEFEKHVGHSQMVKELMHRAHGGRRSDGKINMNSYISKSFRYSKKTSVALMRNIKGVANSMSSFKISEKERDNLSLQGDDQKHKKKNSSSSSSSSSSSEWIKVQQQGKTYKEFTGLQLCQEIQAHEGSIWAMKFSQDARYLASAGEDRVINVWEMQDVEVIRAWEERGSSTPLHPSLVGNLQKAGKSSSTKKKDSLIPDYVNMPETVFAFSEKPVSTLTGHQDEVLDLSWSKSQLLLSSSMDKTVRLWDIETQSCLKMFAHNDYVTCIQFNPADDDYFVSGSLDAKVRIWNVPGRRVVDWTDQKDMVTATSYTPDGEGVIIGLQKGSCRLYRITDCKLEQEEQFDVDPKKKSQNKKITGFQFSESNPSELLITSADSYVRIHDGTNFSQRFKGAKITCSQISASFSQDGKYVICASEDSQVYVWKREEVRGGKGRCLTIQAHEHFPCKDVSVAISWPGRAMKNNNEPFVEMGGSKRHQSNPSSLPPLYPASKKNNLPPLPNKKNDAMLETVSSNHHHHHHHLTEEADEDESCSDQPSDVDSSSISTSCNESTPSQSRRFSSCSLNLPEESGNTQQGGGGGSNAVVQATAWGMVIVTASSGGEIRVYQNFGLPVKANRQTSLFIT
ncbi:unnamed protein product [Cuscuta europaea]|uniref:WD repeat-containing protein 44-like n=1 Tax=Cuscuta europaea TaxID=41803 RepID=A0A9P0ZTM3_CUSEU|nr:unnamed protein product [Cuscuta europaea]